MRYLRGVKGVIARHGVSRIDIQVAVHVGEIRRPVVKGEVLPGRFLRRGSVTAADHLFGLQERQIRVPELNGVSGNDFFYFGLWVKMQAAIGLHRLFYKG